MISFPGSIARVFTSKRDMKRELAVGTVVALTWQCFPGVAQEVSHGELGTTPSITWLGNAETNVIVLPSQPGHPTSPLLAPAGNSPFRFYPWPSGAHPAHPAVPLTGYTNLYWLLRSNSIPVPSPPTNLPPGVYRTVPYSCIVLVPGPHPDDKCIVNPGPWDSSMPIVRPDLHFIPLNRDAQQQPQIDADKHK